MLLQRDGMRKDLPTGTGKACGGIAIRVIITIIIIIAAVIAVDFTAGDKEQQQTRATDHCHKGPTDH